MKIKVTSDAHHSITSGLSQSFAAGRQYNVPKATAMALIDRDVAEQIGGTKPAIEKE